VIKRVFLSAGLLWAGVALLSAQSPAPARPAAARPAANAAQAPAAAAAPAAAQASAVRAAASDAATIDKQKAWVKQYCVACHNTRNPLPANDPVNLETASLDDLTKDAATWERSFAS
jgi:mono/diheme cytochrome c family protein